MKTFLNIFRQLNKIDLRNSHLSSKHDPVGFDPADCGVFVYFPVDSLEVLSQHQRGWEDQQNCERSRPIFHVSGFWGFCCSRYNDKMLRPTCANPTIQVREHRRVAASASSVARSEFRNIFKTFSRNLLAKTEFNRYIICHEIKTQLGEFSCDVGFWVR